MDNNYFGTGRRKEAVARVRLKQGTGEMQIINKDNKKRPLKDYFNVVRTNSFLLEFILQPLKLINKEKEYDTIVRVRGGGFSGQAGAIRLGISKGLLKIFPEYKKIFKDLKLLTRDARRVEPKKPGFKKARKKKQFSKR